MALDTQITVVAPPTPQSPHPDTLTQVTALARYEFEPDRGNDGTKIIMVEWKDDCVDRVKTGSWHVSWTGKTTTFPAADEPVDNVRRSYFLLPPGTSVPRTITIAYNPTRQSENNGETLYLNLTPLPAIFTPELGATAKASGRKGVLHTIWAKKRLQILDKEIKHEQEHNLEGIALEMAAAEKEWIETNFGMAQQPQKPLRLDVATIQNNMSVTNGQPLSPRLQSPKTPGGRRLTEKLKGLSLWTGDTELMQGGNTPFNESHPLSPDNGDMAYSSFGSLRHNSSAQQDQVKPSTRRIIAPPPPEYIRQQQSESSGKNGLDFMNSRDDAVYQSCMVANSTRNDGDDLFAMALSPRSPDDPKSPFSIPAPDIGAFARVKGTPRT